MDVSLALQIIACGFTAAATWLIGNKSTSGPWCNIVAAALFALVNLNAGLWLCAAFSASMAALNCRNYLRWRRERQTSQAMLGKLTGVRGAFSGADLHQPTCRICGSDCGQCGGPCQ